MLNNYRVVGVKHNGYFRRALLGIFHTKLHHESAYDGDAQLTLCCPSDWLLTD